MGYVEMFSCSTGPFLYRVAMAWVENGSWLHRDHKKTALCLVFKGLVAASKLEGDFPLSSLLHSVFCEDTTALILCKR